MHQLANPKLALTLSDTGSLLAVENHLTGETYHFAADTFAVECDLGRFSNDTTRPSGVTATPDGLIFHFAFALHRHRKPDAATPYWNVLPDDANAIARQIADYATQKGISYGFYLGIAGGHGEEGNAAGLSFRPEESSWKKLDAAGRRAPDNCIGCDDFFAWWLQVHDNTIKKYGLSNWSWDPSLGSAMNCYDESHSHIAGKGAYKGWRRCLELTRRLKESNPGLFIQGFYGTKHFGLWGLKYTDQHEVYNEQTAIVCTHHTQCSDDRQNASGW